LTPWSIFFSQSFPLLLSFAKFIGQKCVHSRLSKNSKKMEIIWQATSTHGGSQHCLEITIFLWNCLLLTSLQISLPVFIFMGFELRASHLLGSWYSTTWATPPALQSSFLSSNLAFSPPYSLS
jgi:hypothetical protein